MIVIKNSALRRGIKYTVPFVLIPAVITLGAYMFREKFYSFISAAVLILAFVLFASGFEKRNIGTRRLIVIAIMVALSVAGRFIPFFKPITALTIITAIYLGGEAGFLCGSLSALISNFYFGQGPWTPFQMFSWGIIGLFAGILSGQLRKNRWLLILYGIISGVIFSLVMDIWSVVWYNSTFSLELFLSSVLTALPFTVLYSVSNVIFLCVFEKPFGEKLVRVKKKYGI